MARFLTTTTALLLGATITPASPAQQPNFVFVLVDDLGFMDVGANNPDTFYETPNIDRLAATGVRFTNAYAACPVCSPTRASILSGKYPARLHTTDYFGAPQPERARGNKPLLPARYVDRLPLAGMPLEEIERTAIDIEPAVQTVGELVASLNAVNGLSAAMDSQGRLTMAA